MGSFLQVDVMCPKFWWCSGSFHLSLASKVSLVAQLVKNPPAMLETPVQFLGWEDPLEKGEATHSSILGLPGGSAGKESACSAGDLGLISGLGRCPGEGKGYPLQYSGLENSTDYSPWGCKEWDTTEWLSLGGKGFPGGIGGKAPTCQCRRSKRCRFDPWIGEFPWRRAWQSTPVVLAWRIPWTEEPGGLQSTWSPSVRHDWVTEHESLNTASKHAIVSPFSQYCSWVLLPLWLIPASSFRE